MSVLSARIRQRREALGISQEELAARLGYRSKSSITKIEKGINDIPQNKLLDFAAADMKSFGIDKLYLITDHTSFYERYGWNFLCMVQPDGEPEMIRMYVKRLIT